MFFTVLNWFQTTKDNIIIINNFGLNQKKRIHVLENLKKEFNHLLSHVLHINEYPQHELILKKLKAQFKHTILKENPKKNPLLAKVAYNINKGDVIVLCLMDYQTGEIYPIDNIKYVFLHEVAHSMTKSIGHTTEFYTNFNFLLEIAKKYHFFKYNSNIINKSKNNNFYCGLSLNK